MAELGLRPMPAREAREVADVMRDVFRAATGTQDVTGFPGTMAMTFSRRHSHQVRNLDYVFLEKSDGTRYFLFWFQGDAFLIDRRCLVYSLSGMLNLRSPLDREKPLEVTLLDGELCKNLKLELYEYLVYDAIAINGDLSIAKRGYRFRLRAVDQQVQLPRMLDPETQGAMRVRVKDTYEKSEINLLFGRIMKSGSGAHDYIYENHRRPDGPMRNHNDGLIMTPVHLAYPYKTHEGLLKWKPSKLNSLDFLMRLTKKQTVRDRVERTDVEITLFYQADNHPCRMRSIRLPWAVREMFVADFDRYNNSIAEFSYDIGAGEWMYLRQRDDKDKANYHNVVIDTLQSIAENISLRDVHQLLLGGPPEQCGQDGPRLRIENAAIDNGREWFSQSGDRFDATTPVSVISPPNRNLRTANGDRVSANGPPRNFSHHGRGRGRGR
ncbi:mRNA-capping enzyme subunit alpha [Porphyridium purpureum]|uniref:mRNA guanylyltransferase n=1 Tax=Porphyridium purpureum TaxID=35688 RepID=A0A5J4Z6R4_PORPP|nr:mRNA-capping enzyme subunit alpha [Porphyridium purpureum]|eukprot:POR5379..scf295_1